MKQKIIELLIIIFISFLYGCATKLQPIEDSGSINPMLLGGKSDAMKFSTAMDYNKLNIHDPKIRSIIRVAIQSNTSTIIILYPPNNLKYAEKLYSVISQTNVKVMKPIQSTVIANSGSDTQNIYVYVTFEPILLPQNQGRKYVKQ